MSEGIYGWLSAEQAMSVEPTLEIEIDVQSLPKQVSPPDFWQETAACYGLDPEIFFPTTEEEAGLALSYCGTCSVREMCLAPGTPVVPAPLPRAVLVASWDPVPRRAVHYHEPPSIHSPTVPVREPALLWKEMYHGSTLPADPAFPNWQRLRGQEAGGGLVALEVSPGADLLGVEVAHPVAAGHLVDVVQRHRPLGRVGAGWHA